MSSNHDQTDDADRKGVPVEQSDMTTHLEVGEESHGKLGRRPDWHAAGDIPQRDAEKEGEENIGKGEDAIPERLPHPIIEMASHFNRNTAQQKAPD